MIPIAIPYQELCQELNKIDPFDDEEIKEVINNADNYFMENNHYRTYLTAKTYEIDILADKTMKQENFLVGIGTIQSKPLFSKTIFEHFAGNPFIEVAKKLAKEYQDIEFEDDRFKREMVSEKNIVSLEKTIQTVKDIRDVQDRFHKGYNAFIEDYMNRYVPPKQS